MARDPKPGEAQALEGEDLKTALKRLSKGPMQFAFGYNDRTNPTLLVHKTRSAQSLQNELKTKLGLKTATRGTATADGKALVLDVEGKPIPSMDKLVKLMLRKERVAKYTEATVRMAAGAATLEDSEESDLDARADDTSADPAALQAHLRTLQSRMQGMEGQLGELLRSLSTNGEGDTGLLTAYGRLCLQFSEQARATDDAELVAYGQSSLGRAKKMAGVVKRLRSAGEGAEGPVSASTKPAAAKPATAAPGAPAAPGGAGIEIGWGDKSVGIKQNADGTTLTVKHEESLNLFRQNFKVWVIPCYTTGTLKGSLDGAITVGDKRGAALTATAAGTLELGIGTSNEAFTAGPYGSITLSASNSCSVAYTDQDGLDIQPFTFTVKGSGKVGIKVAIEKGPSVDVEQEVFDWELFVVHVGRYANDKFESIQVKAGKDLLRLVAALESGGTKVADFVEDYAPEFVKQAAVDAAQWTAESEGAGAIADTVQDGLDYVEQRTGVDAGAAVEEVVQSLVDPGGETAAEATERVNQELERFSASQDDLHAVLAASGLNGDLQPFRTAAEYNVIVDAWQAEAELLAKGQPAPGKWRGLTEALVAKARQRKLDQQQLEREQKLKQQQQQDAEVQAAVAAMEAARPAAQGPGNVLNNKLKATPNARAKPFFDKGWQHWAAAEAARKQVGTLQGEAKATQARAAKALYDEARAAFQTGLQYT